MSEPNHGSIDDAGVLELVTEIIGPVLLPEDPAYADECASYNLTTTVAPAVAIGATSASDVQAALRFAARRGMAIAVHEGGAQAAGSANGALLLNLRQMAAVSVDPVARTARIEGAARWQEVMDATAPHGLAPVTGSSRSVDAIGYLLGGVPGPTLRRSLGPAVEYLTEIEVVTADGELHRVTAQAADDLFGALAGGDGDFAVVTAIKINLSRSSAPALEWRP